MEYGSRLRTVIVSLIAIIFLIFLGWGIASIAKSIFSSDKPKTASSDDVEGASVVDLDDISPTSSSVKLTIDGAVVASEEQRSITIEVSSSMVEMYVYKDYGQTIINHVTRQNSQEAYVNFLKSLKASRFANVREGADQSEDDARGKCADGRRYISEVKEIDETIIKLWSTSCSQTQGTSGARMAKVRALFKKQVPEYTELTKDINLY